MKKTTLIIITSLISAIMYGQKTEDLSVHYMLRGCIYAQSSLVDSTALSGFGTSNNSPKKMNKNITLVSNQLLLLIDTTQQIMLNKKYNGYKLYLANTTDSTVKLEASDSRLSVIAEVFYQEKWQPIEYLPTSWCGNSYHYVFLQQNEYWEFKIPKFSGEIKTKLRYKLILDEENAIYSNSINTTFNEKQLEVKPDYTPTDIMDPYDN